MFAECCESSARADMRRETVPESRESEQQHERHERQMIDRVADKTLAEADRKALRALCPRSKLAR